MYARMYPHADTHLYPYTHARGCTHANVYIQCRPRSDAVGYIVASDQGLYCLLLQESIII